MQPVLAQHCARVAASAPDYAPALKDVLVALLSKRHWRAAQAETAKDHEQHARTDGGPTQHDLWHVVVSGSNHEDVEPVPGPTGSMSRE
eukprot:3936667-Rhodomonas_salina.1